MKLHFYADPGHGWLQVPMRKLMELGIQNDISRYSYMRDADAYLEEDADASQFIKALEKAGETYKVLQHHTNRRSRIRDYDTYDATAYDPLSKLFPL